jgi:DNA repair exonuclease SbcCD nuclease subunit
MKICLLGDTHFGIRNDSKVFHAFYEKFYSEVFFPTLEREGVNTIVQLGDLFDRRKYINFLSLTESRRYFFDECAKRNIHLHALIGNHDIFWRESIEVNSPNLLLKDYANITLWQKAGTLELDGVKFDMIPWICKENEEEIYEFVKNSSSPVCVGHFELEGFDLMKGIPSHGGHSSEFLKNYTQVFSGHYHTRSQKNNVEYIGTPYELFWNDYKDKKYFVIYDTDTMKTNYVVNPNVMFHKINYDDSKLTMEQMSSHDYTPYKNSYVKIVVLNKQNPYIFDKMLDEIYKVGPIDITIVEDFTESLTIEDDDIVDQAQDTMTILSNFIDAQSLNISDTNKLKTLMRELYVESLSRETVE